MYKSIIAISFLGLIMFISSCDSGQKTNTDTSSPNYVHKVVASEVLQASAYTYLKVKENNKETWIAVPSMVAKPGDTYYYTGGLVMPNFNSKELNRTFESIVFLQNISTDPQKLAEDKAKPKEPEANSPHTVMNENGQTTSAPPAEGETYKRNAPQIEKKEVKIEPAKGGVTIKELYANKGNYKGKKIKVKGEVTKYTPGVMNKNWIHIQDGTDNNGKFDFVVTTDAEVTVGDKVTLEGNISLDKDLGYGYFFEVIMEDAKLVK